MKATVNTNSNFKNSNGLQLEVVEIYGNRVTCLIPFYGFDSNKNPAGNMVKADFLLSEIIEFTKHKF